MRFRDAFSLIETVLVVAIVSVMLALVFPAVQKVRELSKRSVCQNNLRQVGLAASMYHDSEGTFPAVRRCPAPLERRADPECQTLPSPDTYTGPNEVWWCLTTIARARTPPRRAGLLSKGVDLEIRRGKSKHIHVPAGSGRHVH